VERKLIIIDECGNKGGFTGCRGSEDNDKHLKGVGIDKLEQNSFTTFLKLE
jgi:hypothetical protein